MTIDCDYDLWDTPRGMAQDLIDKQLMEKEIERRFENDEYKGE